MITYCFPYYERYDDLIAVWPHVRSACAGADVLCLDYGSPTMAPSLDGLRVVRTQPRGFYHMAHARNVAIRQALGDSVVMSSADIMPKPGFLEALRDAFEAGATFVTCASDRFVGVLACRRDELISAGGYDERFEFYGPEDRELIARLRRRGGREATYPARLLGLIPTPDSRKLTHYRLPLTKRQMAHLGRLIMDENGRNAVIVANQGKEWGCPTSPS